MLFTPLPESFVSGSPPERTGNVSGMRLPSSFATTGSPATPAREARTFQCVNFLLGFPFSKVSVPIVAPVSGSLSASVPTTLRFESSISSWPDATWKNAASSRENPKLSCSSSVASTWRLPSCGAVKPI